MFCVLHNTDTDLGFEPCANCDGATVLYIKLSHLHSGVFSALLRRATTYKHQNKLQEAREDLQSVLRVEPHNDVAKVNLENDVLKTQLCLWLG